LQEDHLETAPIAVSVLGLGAMGSVVAATLVQARRRIAIWNRSPEKATRLAALGATASATAAGAVSASPVSLLVFTNAAAALETVEASRHTLAGRTIVNYSSGSDREVEALRELVHDGGGLFLQGTILAYPRNVGHRETYFVYAGDAEAFETHRALLNDLSGHALLLSLPEARAFVSAFIVQAYVAIGGFYEAVAIGAHLGLARPWLTDMLLKAPRFFAQDAMEDAARRFASGDFGSDQATIDIHALGFDIRAASLGACGATSPMFDTFRGHMERAHAAGLGGEDIAAVIKVIAADPQHT
jgi:3-hydroxyisobutyrate dehydrogenase-like beta-hydroxyacid dehydrogenase